MVAKECIDSPNINLYIKVSMGLPTLLKVIRLSISSQVTKPTHFIKIIMVKEVHIGNRLLTKVSTLILLSKTAN